MCSLLLTRHASVCLVCSVLCYCSFRWREFLNSARSKQFHYRRAAVLQNTVYNPKEKCGAQRVRWWMKPATEQPAQQRSLRDARTKGIACIGYQTRMEPYVNGTLGGARWETAKSTQMGNPAWRYIRSFHELHIPPVLQVVPEYMCNSCALFY